MENIQKKMFFNCKFSADIFLSFVLPIQPKFFVSDPQQSQQHSDSERRYIGIKKYQSQTEFSLSVLITRKTDNDSNITLKNKYVKRKDTEILILLTKQHRLTE